MNSSNRFAAHGPGGFVGAGAGLVLALVVASVIALSGCDESSSSAFRFLHNPILFVHGFHENASFWNSMMGKFRRDGYPASFLLAYTYDSTASNEVDAEKVKSQVELLLQNTGASKVDIIAHSMGSLNSRWYIKFLGGESKVDDWVSLGGPNHGSTLADPCTSGPCGEMRPGSPFLEALNAGDETPGGVHYGTWWSPCDELVSPHESVVLNGATATETACISHHALLTDETVYEQVREFVK